MTETACADSQNWILATKMLLTEMNLQNARLSWEKTLEGTEQLYLVRLIVRDWPGRMLRLFLIAYVGHLSHYPLQAYEQERVFCLQLVYCLCVACVDIFMRHTANYISQ